MRAVRFFLCCAVTAFGCALAGAQTFYGPGGLIINPTAYTNHQGYMQEILAVVETQVDSETLARMRHRAEKGGVAGILDVLPKQSGGS